MMLPPVTNSPAKAFTPRRCALESRPLEEEPPPFLCAIALPRCGCHRHSATWSANLQKYCAADAANYQNRTQRSRGYLLSALKLLPFTRISLIFTSTKFWRWPCSFLYCFLRL